MKTVVYLKNSAGIKKGKTKQLPDDLANSLVKKGVVEIEGSEKASKKESK